MTQAYSKCQGPCGEEFVTSTIIDGFVCACCKVDPINPPHYHSHPSGIECIQVTEHMSFLVGNAVKYLWRAGSKGSETDDLRKAMWYIERRIAQLEA